MPRDTNTQNAKKNNMREDLRETLKSDENKTCITPKLDEMFFKRDDIIEKHSETQWIRIKNLQNDQWMANW